MNEYYQYRNKIGKKHGWCCFYCGIVLSLKTLTLDHVVPLSLGGLDNSCNIVAACRDCNNWKGDCCFLVRVEGDDFVFSVPTRVGHDMEVTVHRNGMRKKTRQLLLEACYKLYKGESYVEEG